MKSHHRVTYFTTIPSPYRVDYFNRLAQRCDLEVVFEAQRDPDCRFNLYSEASLQFSHSFLSEDKSYRHFLPKGVWQGVRKRAGKLILHTWYTRTEIVLLLLLKLLHREYWIETDGNILDPTENALKAWVKAFLLRGAAGYFSPSQQTDRYLLHYGIPQGRIYRYSFTSVAAEDIPEAPVTAEQKRAIRQELAIVPDAFVVLYVGQLIHRKGIDVLLQALANVQGNWQLYVVGGDPSAEYLDQCQELGVTDRVHFVEYCKKERLSHFYQAADLFVLPTREDIWGLVINEAMSHGLPVITTNNCLAGVEMLDHPEITLVPVDDAHRLAVSITTIAQNRSLCEQLGTRNLQYSRSHTIEQMVEEHIAVL